MKTPPKKKTSVKTKKSAPVAPTPDTSSRTLGPIEALLHEAEQEPDRGVLDDCLGVIRTLRGKDFSFREIASWLSARGIEANHNAVYRVYMNNLTRDEAMEESVRQDEEKLKAEALQQ